ncbi:MAG: 50S ribosomal protein L3 [Armatimonadota bacterium]|nr:50S ribosomal protein L3 [Armatimonadota bacterium]MDR7453969.1 50S ribosomal protein L3 [Armatimonadota bacterium]MDR7497664.1 50S ribosomal protein L3 [Armatimonadota bacterium]MDR7512847.1 50S ribosomal protein L3 [Armatimonadota bacterium]
MPALLGRKLGMTRVFADDGTSVPVTVVEAGPCVVVDTRTPQRDGYAAVRVAFEPVSERKLTRGERGVFAKRRLPAHRVVRELRLPTDGVEPGQTLTVEAFEPGQLVDVTGTSIGKGFAGAMKRHGFGGQRDSHGVSLMHRAVGSIGSSDIARVFPGKRMPGRAGGRRVTVKRLRVVRVDAKNNLLLLRGAVPGVRGALLLVRSVG